MRGFAAIGLHQPKIDSNIDGALRAADCYGAGLVAITGQRYKHSITDTTKAYRSIPVLNVEKDIFTACPFDCVPVAVELLSHATKLVEFNHPERAFYIFGAEDHALGKDVLEKCKHTVFIPTTYCMNLAATVNVVLYDRLAKQNQL